MAYVQLFRDTVIVLLNDSVDFLELGSGTTPFDLNDTSLETPFFRKAITSKTIKLTELESTVAILAGEANTQSIHEIGVYSGGNLVLGSGELVSRIVFDEPLSKTSSNTLNFVRKDKVNI